MYTNNLTSNSFWNTVINFKCISDMAVIALAKWNIEKQCYWTQSKICFFYFEKISIFNKVYFIHLKPNFDMWSILWLELHVIFKKHAGSTFWGLHLISIHHHKANNLYFLRNCNYWLLTLEICAVRVSEYAWKFRSHLFACFSSSFKGYTLVIFTPVCM